MAGVHFMAETAKLMSPNKKVILPDMDAGCLSSSITGKDVRLLKKNTQASQLYLMLIRQQKLRLKQMFVVHLRTQLK